MSETYEFYKLEPLFGLNSMRVKGDGAYEGRFAMTLLSLFPGVTLAWNCIYCESLPTEKGIGAPFSEVPIAINIGLKGSCEVERLDGSVSALRAGEASVSRVASIRKQCFPGKGYEGVEVFLEPERVAEEFPELEQWFGVREEDWAEFYYGSTGAKICTCNTAVHRAAERLMKGLPSLTPELLPSIRLEVLQLLRELCENPLPESGHTYLTETQASLARALEQRMTEDLRAHVYAKDLAQEYGLSDTSLKNYFRVLYGQSVSEYMRAVRMKEAARLLLETDLSVGRIAEEVGYQNQSKFAAVFRETYGTSPLAYRRSHRTLNKPSETK